MKTVDISEQMRILQLLCTHVQSSFRLNGLDLKVSPKTPNGKILIELTPKDSLGMTGEFSSLMRGLGYLRDFSLMAYKAEDWEKGIETALLVLKNTETSVNFSTGKVSFKLPSNTAQYHTRLRDFLGEQLQGKLMEFCTITRLWEIAWKFSEMELTLERVTVSSDRVFQFEIAETHDETEEFLAKCMEGLSFLAPIPED